MVHGVYKAAAWCQYQRHHRLRRRRIIIMITIIIILVLRQYTRNKQTATASIRSTTVTFINIFSYISIFKQYGL